MLKKQYSYIGKYSAGGSQNSFYQVSGKKYGFKSFPNKSLATFAHSVQSDLSKSNLAPRVYSPVCRIRVPNYFIETNGGTKTLMVLSDWGYLTEIAEPYECTSGEDCDGDCANDGCCINNDRIRDLLDGIYGYGLEYIDAHSANLGYVKRGKKKVLVVIDLGAESIIDEEGNYPDVCWDGSEDMDCCCDKCVARCEYV